MRFRVGHVPNDEHSPQDLTGDVPQADEHAGGVVSNTRFLPQLLSMDFTLRSTQSSYLLENTN